MKHHKGKEEKSTSCAKQQRAPAGEKGRGVLDGRWSRSRAPTEGVSPSLGCDGSARHRAGGVLAPFKAGSVRGRANQGGTTAASVVLDEHQGRLFCLLPWEPYTQDAAQTERLHSRAPGGERDKVRGENCEPTHHSDSASEQNLRDRPHCGPRPGGHQLRD